MRKPKIFFSPIEGSSLLSISWFSGPLGDAVEAKSGSGVGFFSKSGELLSVEFDDVEEAHDHQILQFDRYQVEVSVSAGKVSHTVRELSAPKRSRRLTKKKTRRAA